MSVSPNTAAKRVPMDSVRKTALVAGILYLITFAASIPAIFFLDPVLSNPNYIASAGADARVTFGALLELVTALAGIGTAVALFSVVKRQHEGLALGFVTSRMFEGAVIVVGVLSILTVVALRQAGAAAGDAAALVPVGQALVAVREQAFLIGPGMACVNALLLGTLLYRSRLVPRAIPMLGLIGAPIFLSSQIGVIFGINEVPSVWLVAGLAPIFIWELSLGLWMTFKGFNRSSPLIAGTETAGRAEDSTPVLPSRTAAAPKAGLA